MRLSIEQFYPHDPDWQQLCQALSSSITLTALVLTAWKIGLWIAKAIVEQQLSERSQLPTLWSHCPGCGTSLVSKGFVNRRILTLVGWVEWRRRVGRCPRRCLGSQSTPFDQVLGIDAYQQTSTELMRLGCLLAVFLPFELAAWFLHQLSGIQVSEDTIWNWVQVAGQRAMTQLKVQLQQLSEEKQPSSEILASDIAQMPLAIAADGVTVPFRSQYQMPKGKIVWREVKIVLFAHLGKYETHKGQKVSLHQRRLVAVLGDIDDLKPRLQLEALRQGITTATQVVWISDGARGFWRLYRECFAEHAIGILDFYHAAQHLWQAASVYHNGNPARTPQRWFDRMRHQLRHGFGQRIIKELDWLSKSKNTDELTKPILRQVRDYLLTHIDHIQYRQFKKQGLPIGSGMVESACKWLIGSDLKEPECVGVKMDLTIYCTYD